MEKNSFPKSDKTHRGNASQFFVAGELCRRGLVAVVTMGNCPNTDILCSNKEGTKFVHIQVKTFRPGDKTCSVGRKAEKNYGANFFWILGGIPTMDSQKEFEHYIIPSTEMSKNIKEAHSKWLKEIGKKGQAHNDSSIRTAALPPRKGFNGWDISRYLDKWDLILEKLK
ncbi:hypothetical protein D4R52_03620 [bacterium]|nr:MAG: hypothetical protein D4R52_03620 [bacterium]